ncbi:(d)CMP kinase [Candidatus Babeliales bacterium]|nr:(d)CMP kinase [Candidatus Babeliales bacterium]
MIITIDGPVASGKSSVAKALAKELGFYYLYTGLLYRAVAYLLIKENGGDFAQGLAHEWLATSEVEFIKDICYDYGEESGNSRPYIFYKNEEITEHLYDRSLEQPASIVSANKYVRAGLLETQRNIGKKYDIVADGRDCGSVVFPEADYKFYLTADVDVRVRRLLLDKKRHILAKSIQAEEKTSQLAKEELERRDKRDREREVAPLVIPEGAIVVDNSKLSQLETINKFLACIKV